MKRSKGFRKKTRKKLKAPLRNKFTPEKLMKEFKPEEKVIIKQLPFSHRGMPHPRYKGKVGVVKEKRGNAYVISVRNNGKEMTIISCPEHLRKV